jgi:hypothetical protein
MSYWFMGKITKPLNEQRARLGLTPLNNLLDHQRSPYLHLMPTTLAFEFSRPHLDATIRFVGPLIPATPAGFQPPHWWHEMHDRHVVHVTQGTVATNTANLVKPTIEPSPTKTSCWSSPPPTLPPSRDAHRKRRRNGPPPMPPIACLHACPGR